MSITTAAPGAAAYDPARDLRAAVAQVVAAKQAADARKAEVAADAARARSSPAFEAQDTRKSQARAKLQQVREWLKIVRKLYAQNPQGMARALAQVFKDLKAAVRDYADAGGKEMGMAGDAVGAVLAPSPRAGDGDKPPAEPDQTPSRAPSDGAALYGQVAGEVRKMIGEDGLDFLKDVRGMVEDIKQLLASARIQAAGRRHDKATDRSFEDADKALKSLNDEMDHSESDIRQAAPDVGMKLSVVG